LIPVYEDNHIIIVYKQSGEIVQSDKTGDVPLSDIVRQYIREEHHKPGNVYLGVVHRLDRDTSGLLVYAKTIEAEQILEHNWSRIVTDRRYVALVSGEMRQKEGVVESWLKDNKAYITYSSPTDNGGKFARTHYRTLRRSPNYSLVELKLDTGRKNQIRVHLQDLGCPVCGDIKYGNGDDPIGRLCLHAFRLDFYHPITREPLHFETPVPKAFSKVFAESKKKPEATEKES